jgi:hypothetical protein
MKTVGRNDFCPCGSGKKYKKCCLQTVDQNDFEYRRQRNIESALVPLLFEFAGSMLKDTAVDDAWVEFYGDDEVEPFSPDNQMNMVFMPWFLFNWIFDLETYLLNEASESEEDGEPLAATIAQVFFATMEEHLTEDQRAFLNSAMYAPYTLCEVLEVRPSAGMKLRDLLREREFSVIEHTASQSLKRGEIIYCAPIKIGSVVSNLGTSPYALRPTCKLEVLNCRSEILSELDTQTLDDDDLLDFEEDLRYLYLELLSLMFAPPQLVNTDGEPLLPQRLHFDIDSTDEAFHKLKDLAGDIYQEELLKEATMKQGLVVEAEIPWVQEEPAGTVLFGLLMIKNDQLVVEVNSAERAYEILEVIAERLGDHAEYKMTSISPLEGAVEDLWEQALNDVATGSHSTNVNITGATSNEGSDSKTLSYFDAFSAQPEGFDPDLWSGSEAVDPGSPEVQECLKKLSARYWSNWFDLPVPALDNMTPREAAVTSEGRDLLESLLLEYEIRIDCDPDNNAVPDIAFFRRELGMD